MQELTNYLVFCINYYYLIIKVIRYGRSDLNYTRPKWHFNTTEMIIIIQTHAFHHDAKLLHKSFYLLRYHDTSTMDI